MVQLTYTVILEVRDGVVVPLCAVEGVGIVWRNPDHLGLYSSIVRANDPNEATETAMHEIEEQIRAAGASLLGPNVAPIESASGSSPAT